TKLKNAAPPNHSPSARRWDALRKVSRMGHRAAGRGTRREELLLSYAARFARRTSPNTSSSAR
ncbi:MAG TPA: hypothetical protein VH092_21370, partial [Urbifossiella sp.]|nr:hypothetical protein [Urbifossiella sp.]